jgi:uncharacterized protein with HEPN domain
MDSGISCNGKGVGNYGIGNILRHEYERVDPAIMWDIVQNHIPSMQVVIARMISDVPDER